MNDFFLIMCYTHNMENVNLCVGGCRIQQLNEIVNKILDPKITVVVTTAPAPRVALGEYFNLPQQNLQSKIVGFFKMLGVDYVFDTAFGADLTTISEAYEFLDRLETNQGLPMFNSCCPAFVKYIQNFHKDLIPNVSQAKTPIAQIATYTKTVFAQEHNLNAKDIYIIALTPCIAKKLEIKSNFIESKVLSKFDTKQDVENLSQNKKISNKSLELLNKLSQHQQQCSDNCEKLKNIQTNLSNDKIQLTDAVLTTAELVHLINLCELGLNDIPDCQCDELVGQSVKFGASGGVLQCIIDNCYYLKTNELPPNNLLNISSCTDTLCEIIVPLKISEQKTSIKVAKIMGLRNIEQFFVSQKYKEFDFVEVMSCVGGCIGGTGQPTNDAQTLQNRKSILLKDQTKNFALQNKIALEYYKNYSYLCYDN